MGRRSPRRPPATHRRSAPPRPPRNTTARESTFAPLARPARRPAGYPPELTPARSRSSRPQRAAPTLRTHASTRPNLQTPSPPCSPSSKSPGQLHRRHDVKHPPERITRVAQPVTRLRHKARARRPTKPCPLLHGKRAVDPRIGKSSHLGLIAQLARNRPLCAHSSDARGPPKCRRGARIHKGKIDRHELRLPEARRHLHPQPEGDQLLPKLARRQKLTLQRHDMRHRPIRGQNPPDPLPRQKSQQRCRVSDLMLARKFPPAALPMPQLHLQVGRHKKEQGMHREFHRIAEPVAQRAKEPDLPTPLWR